MSGRLRRVVCQTVALGLALPVLTLAVLHDAGPVVPGPADLPGPEPLLLLGALLLLTVLANRVAVPVRRGEQIEELTLLESAVVVDVLLLPAVHALWVPVLAVVLSSLAVRRDAVKSLFNAANLAAASAVLVLAVHLLSGAGSGLSPRTVAGLLVGLVAFTVVNLANLARVLAAVQEREAAAVLTDGTRLAVLTVPGHLSMAGSAVLAGSAAPALVPFALVPAVAMVFAFRARAQQVLERERSARLLVLSQTLATLHDPQELLTTFLPLARQAFDADLALVQLQGQPEQLLAVDRDGVTGNRQHAAALLALGGQDGSARLIPAMPDGGRGLLAPLAAQGRHVGALLLTGARLDARALPVLTPLAGLLAAALQAAGHVQRLTEATGRLQDVVDQSSDGILVLDGHGLVQLWSPALAALTGITEQRAVGAPAAQLLAARTPDGQQCAPFTVPTPTPAAPHTVVEQVLLRADGEQRVVRCAHTAGFDEQGVLRRDVVLVHDVTRERQVERLKADFIATVSHELRTPVTPIKGYADLLRRRGEAMTAQRRAECLDVISDRCDHLARLVEDLLLASRISAAHGAPAAQVDCVDVALLPLLHRVIDDLGPAGRRVALVAPQPDVQVHGDPLRTVQVLSNLVSNALKYSPDGSRVDIETGASAAGSAVWVQVRDRGRGIPADQLEQVFDKFHRVEDPLRMTTGGTGLGLYIARQLTVAMGGTLSCDSTLGHGSTFTVQLPAATGTATADTGTAPALAASPPSPRAEPSVPSRTGPG